MPWDSCLEPANWVHSTQLCYVMAGGPVGCDEGETRSNLYVDGQGAGGSLGGYCYEEAL
jgi:hypothetical protein